MLYPRAQSTLKGWMVHRDASWLPSIHHPLGYDSFFTLKGIKKLNYPEKKVPGEKKWGQLPETYIQSVLVPQQGFATPYEGCCQPRILLQTLLGGRSWDPPPQFSKCQDSAIRNGAGPLLLPCFEIQGLGSLMGEGQHLRVNGTKSAGNRWAGHHLLPRQRARARVAGTKRLLYPRCKKMTKGNYLF